MQLQRGTSCNEVNFVNNMELLAVWTYLKQTISYV